MSVQIVFSDDKDLDIFRRGLRLLHPSVPDSAWTPVVANISDEFLQSIGLRPKGDIKQVLAAWKKWYGMAHLMDLGPSAPAYGLMLDAELLLYDATDCGPGSAWYTLYERIRRSEATKTFPASQTSSTLGTYHVGGDRYLNGCSYNRGIIQRNADWVTPGGTACLKKCTEPGCAQVRRQIEQCLWSWWTDLPYVNLKIAARLLQWVTSPAWQARFGKIYNYAPATEDRCAPEGPERWRRLLRRVRFPMFEHVCYQQWCVLNEGFSFRDVTDVTGPAVWGSYLEDPVPGSNFSELRPLWVSGQAVVLSEQGRIRRLSAEEPPLVIFHVDHQEGRFNAGKWMSMWKPVIAGAR